MINHERSLGTHYKQTVTKSLVFDDIASERRHILQAIDDADKWAKAFMLFCCLLAKSYMLTL